VLAVAEGRGVPPAQVALAWLLAQPAVTSPIVGITRREHLDDAIAAVDLELTDDEVADLSTGYVPHGVAGHQ
jgi:aryl-alcohol dehydrogenase (NADP+)